LFTNSFGLVTTILTGYIVFFRQKNYNPTIIIQIILLLVTYLSFCPRDYWRVFTGQTGLSDKDMPTWIWDLNSIGEVAFLLQHWVFAVQYLKVALVFELAFTVRTQAVEEKRKSRERVILVTNIVAYVVLSVSLLILFMV
jgi:multidrug transporter EmrE-like cation transporter